MAMHINDHTVIERTARQHAHTRRGGIAARPRRRHTTRWCAPLRRRLDAARSRARARAPPQWPTRRQSPATTRHSAAVKDGGWSRSAPMVRGRGQMGAAVGVNSRVGGWWLDLATALADWPRVSSLVRGAASHLRPGGGGKRKWPGKLGSASLGGGCGWSKLGARLRRHRRRPGKANGSCRMARPPKRLQRARKQHGPPHQPPNQASNQPRLSNHRPSYCPATKLEQEPPR